MSSSLRTLRDFCGLVGNRAQGRRSDLRRVLRQNTFGISRFRLLPFFQPLSKLGFRYLEIDHLLLAINFDLIPILDDRNRSADKRFWCHMSDDESVTAP